MIFYPETCHPDDAIAEMEMARDFKDFYYDVQCRGYYPAYKLKELERQNIIVEIFKIARHFHFSNRIIGMTCFRIE